MTLKLNDFQHGIEEVRDRVASLIGERLTGDKRRMTCSRDAGPALSKCLALSNTF